MAMTIICQRCGITGQIERTGLNGDAQPAHLFRYRGHNPFSGDLHYQCPACGIVLLVDPVAILDSLTSQPPGTAAGESRATPDDRQLLGKSYLRKLLGNHHAS